MENNYSKEWKKRGDRTGLLRNALLKSMGYTDKDIEKPIVGIVFHRNLDKNPQGLWKTLWELWNNCSDKSKKIAIFQRNFAKPLDNIYIMW